MENFRILTLGAFISGKEIELAIAAFAEFYHSVTSKHQKKSKLCIIEQSSNIASIKKVVDQHRIESAIEIICWEEQDQIETVYKSASALLLPTFKQVESVFVEALSFGLPILSFEKPNQEEYVDQSCGMMVTHDSVEGSIYDFSQILHLLYFDPEARKILKKGAIHKYETQFTWGSKRRLEPSS